MTARIRLHEGNRKWWTLAAMCFALFMIMLDNTVVNVALPSIQRDLHASISSLEWTVNAYTLTFAVLLVTGGRLGDIFGRRTMFLFGVVVFATSSALIGFAPNQELLVSGRAIQGVGAAFMMPGTLSIISDAFPPAERGRAIGTWAGVSALALAIGPVLGGALTEYVSWRAIFFLNLPVAAGAVAVTLFAARNSRDETVNRSIDFPGIAAISVGLTGLILALIEGNQWGWGSGRIIGLLAAATVGLIAFALIETHRRAPMVDFSFFRSRTFLGANLVAVVISFAMMAQFFFLALYMQNILDFSALQAGVRFLPSTLMIVAVAPLAGRLSDRIGPKPPIVAGLSLLALSLFMQSQISDTSGYGTLLPAFIVMGVGIALTMSPMSTAAMNAVEVTKAGVASGTLSMSRMVGASLGVAVTGALFQNEFSNRVGQLTAGTPLAKFPSGQMYEAVSSGQASHIADGASPQQSAQLLHIARDGFVHALAGSLRLSVAIVVVGMVIAAALIQGRVLPRRRSRVEEEHPEALAEPMGAQ
jgi:EmrB/QacA subfamily drug resistance transporter